MAGTRNLRRRDKRKRGKGGKQQQQRHPHPHQQPPNHSCRILESPPPLTAFPSLATKELTTFPLTKDDDNDNDKTVVTATRTTTFADVVRSNNNNKKNVTFLSPFVVPTIIPSTMTESSGCREGGDDDDDAATTPPVETTPYPEEPFGQCRRKAYCIHKDDSPPKQRTVFRRFAPDVRHDDLLVALLTHLIPTTRRDEEGGGGGQQPWTDELRSLVMDFYVALQRGMTRAWETAAAAATTRPSRQNNLFHDHHDAKANKKNVFVVWDNDDDDHHHHHQVTRMQQKVVEDTCWSFQDRFDQVCYQGERGAFLHYCRLVGLTEIEWQELVQETILQAQGRLVVDDDDDDDSKEEELPPVPCTPNPQQVVRELQEALTTCWECHGSHQSSSCRVVDCGTTSTDTMTTMMMVCSQCSIPRYCSQKCQAIAWASGHSTRCRTVLKHTHALMKETLAIVSHAAATRSIHGIHTDPIRDFMFSTLVMDPQIHMIKTQFILTTREQEEEENDMMMLEGPSMKFYYQNLAAIRRGEWWVFTDPCTEDDFREVLDSKANDLLAAQQRGELPQVQWLAWIQILLTFNLQGVIDKAQKMREEDAVAATATATSDMVVDDPLDMSALSIGMESSYRADSHHQSPRLLTSRYYDGMMQNDMSGRTVTECHELDSAVIEALLHPASWIHCYRNFYGVSMPSEVFLKACTSDKPHELSMEQVKQSRDFATWFVYKDLQNVYHK
jgi:hypothetical protein